MLTNVRKIVITVMATLTVTTLLDHTTAPAIQDILEMASTVLVKNINFCNRYTRPLEKGLRIKTTVAIRYN